MMNTTTRNQRIPIDWIKKWQAEIVAWKKMLSSRMEENVSIKNKISYILKHNYNQNCLDEIEEFQTMSIREDEITSILRSEVAELDNLLIRKKLEDIKFPKSLNETINHLRNDMVYSEERFASLTSAFSEFQKKICIEKESREQIIN